VIGRRDVLRTWTGTTAALRAFSATAPVSRARRAAASGIKHRPRRADTHCVRTQHTKSKGMSKAAYHSSQTSRYLRMEGREVFQARRRMINDVIVDRSSRPRQSLPTTSNWLSRLRPTKRTIAASAQQNASICARRSGETVDPAHGNNLGGSRFPSGTIVAVADARAEEGRIWLTLEA